MGNLSFGLTHRQLCCRVALEGETVRPKRAEVACGGFRRTDLACKVHQSLVKIAAALSRKNALAKLPHNPIRLAARRFMQVQQSRANPADVGVQRGFRGTEGDRGDCPCGISANPRQAPEGGNIGRDLPGIILKHHSGSFVQVAGAAIVAKPFPEPKHIAFFRCREYADFGKTRDKSLEIWDYSLNPGLLEHDFRDPGLIGCGIKTPGQRPGVCIVPM